MTVWPKHTVGFIHEVYMRFEREKDIPELQEKTRKQRQALRQHARIQDPTIPKVELLCIVLTLFFIPAADWIAGRVGSPSLLSWFGIFVALAAPFALGFRGLFITPRIRRALASNGNAKI